MRSLLPITYLSSFAVVGIAAMALASCVPSRTLVAAHGPRTVGPTFAPGGMAPDARTAMKSVWVPRPVYPPDLLKEGTEGSVSVYLIISSNGRVKSARVEKTTDPRFNEATLKAARAARCRPWKATPGHETVRARKRFHFVAIDLPPQVVLMP